MTHFCEVVERFTEDLRGEKIGCQFGWEAAKEDKVLYVEYEPRQIWQTFIRFIEESRSRVMALIPTGSQTSPIPSTFLDGRALALQMYEELFLTCRMISIENHNELCKNRTYNSQAAFSTVPIIGESIEFTRDMLAIARVQEVICNSIPKPGSLFGLQVIEPTGDVEQVIPFAMAPYYTPVHNNQQHPRFARDYGLFLTLQTDIDYVMRSRTSDVTDAQAWKLRATGKKYRTQGLHIPIQISE